MVQSHPYTVKLSPAALKYKRGVDTQERAQQRSSSHTKKSGESWDCLAQRRDAPGISSVCTNSWRVQSRQSQWCPVTVKEITGTNRWGIRFLPNVRKVQPSSGTEIMCKALSLEILKNHLDVVLDNHVLGWSHLSKGRFNQMTSKNPFQTQPFCDPVWLSENDQSWSCPQGKSQIYSLLWIT